MNAQRTNGRMHPQIEDVSLSRSWYGQVAISPAAAEEILRNRNAKNRRPRVRHASHLAGVMAAGEWNSSQPHGLVFSRHGDLIDGQHRLMAVVASGVTVVMYVTGGADPEVREYIDTGVPRRLEDLMQFHDDAKLNQYCAQIISALYTARMQDSRPSHTSRIPHAAASAIFASCEAGILYAADVMKKKRDRGVGRAGVMAAIAEFYQLNPSLAVQFTESLCKPDGQMQQARIFRDWLLRHPGGGGAKLIRDMYRRAVYVMRMVLAGREIRSVRESESWT